MDLRLDLVINGLFKVKQGGNMNDEAIEFAFNKKWINDFERDFYLKVKDKRSFSQKQYDLLTKINEDILKAWSLQNPSKAIRSQTQQDDSSVMPFGKYQGKLLAEVVPQDKDYFIWLVAESNAATIELKKKISVMLIEMI